MAFLMFKNKKKNALWATAGFLLCLLAFFQLSDSVPRVSSLASQSKTINSSASINYLPTGAALLVTDSTPEGSVPYEIDGKTGYQTGSAYVISAGNHSIELPSPYTSPISNIMYNFSYWLDNNSTANPRTVTFMASETRNLHAIYAASASPPPPPPPPINGTWIARTGFEPPTTSSSLWEYNAGIGEYIELDGSGRRQIITTDYVSGSRSLEFTYNGDGVRHEWKWLGSPLWGHNEVYESRWIKIVEARNFYWWQFWECRDYDTRGTLSIYICSSDGGTNTWWDFHFGHLPNDYPESFGYLIYPNNVVVQKAPVASARVSYNAHEVPRNRWFRLESYVYRDSGNNGIFKTWITDPQNPNPSRQTRRILLSIEGVKTCDDPNMSDINLELVKLYGGLSSGNGLIAVLHVDDLYIANYNAGETS